MNTTGKLFSIARLDGFVARKTLLGLVCGAMASTMAVAQAGGGGGRGPRFSPEELQTAWKVEATSVAKSLELSGEETGKVVEIYSAARQAHGEKMRESLSGGGGGDPIGRFQAMQDLNAEAGKALETALKEAIGDEKTGKAMATLGTFDRQWDGLALALSNLGLEDDKLQEAMTHVNAYVVDMAKAQEEAIASMSMDALRTARTEGKTKLDESLGKILSAEQLAKWAEATVMRGRGGRGPGGGQGPGGGGQAPPQN